jgi:hypothetical protein
VGFQSELFEEYICENESVKFCLNLKILVDCLHIFGSASETTSATMSYSVSMFTLPTFKAKLKMK